jgi:hypothetical protein
MIAPFARCRMPLTIFCEYTMKGRICMSEKYQHIVIKKDGKIMESYIRKIEGGREGKAEEKTASGKELHKNK